MIRLMKTLLIGGARSGKSSLAARWSNERSQHVCCIVTALASDAEMAARISLHRRERPAHWRVREEPVRLGAALRDESRGNSLLLLDCLTLWVSNCLWPPRQANASEAWPTDLPGWRAQREEFLAALQASVDPVIIVSNEVGTGIVPEHAAARVFRDEQGWLNQEVAAACDEVFFVTAGLPLRLK
jgi:adenosylcobinamide kinase / adenosylcobinamide-phosphate guanylyltransferase